MDSYSNLEKRVSLLGNHLQKFIFTIRRLKDNFIQDLDNSGKLMQIDLWHSSFSVIDDMNMVVNLSHDREKNIENLSCYYSIQYLYMFLRNIDILTLGIVSGDSQTDVYHQFLIQFSKEYKDLSNAYLENLIKLYLNGKKTPDYFICTVGTNIDQDDIDLGIITENTNNVEIINSVLKHITQHMLVYATPLHLYLSEHVGKEDYTSTITEYDDLLKKQIQNVVIISEILNAEKILGSDKLFNQFKRKITDKYYYNSDKDIRFHEGFLRGILGEARTWLITPPQTDAISPKTDALRMLKAILYAKKTIFKVNSVNPWEIIKELSDHEPHLCSHYELLFKALSFLEMVKFLMQLYIIQEETFRLEDLDPSQLNLIAEHMGYKPIGTVNSWDQLIIDYYRYVREVRKICDFFMDDIKKHLKSISVIIKLLNSDHPKKVPDSKEQSLVFNFIDKVRFYTGTKYWEDVLNLMEENPDIVDEFIRGFKNLDEEDRDTTIKRYIRWAQFTLISLMHFVTLIGKQQTDEIGDTLFLRMSKALLEFAEKQTNTMERLCRIYSHYPQLIHEFMQLIPEVYFEYFDRIFNQHIINERFTEYRHQLKELCNIHRWSGQYFHRFFYWIINNHPEYLTVITERSELSKISSGLLAEVDVYPDYNDKKKILGDYYDLEFLRIGIGTMHGVELKVTNYEFTEFCDNYMKSLFKICSEEIMREFKDSIPSLDNFAILAAGGHARRQAYDDDYDIISITASDDQNYLKYTTKIMVRINRELLNRGLLAHYRLGEILGGFVNTIPQIRDYLESNDNESFIDLSQLLGARIIIGNSDVEKIISEKILKPCIFDRKKEYIEKMIEEIYTREKINKERTEGTIGLKEARGGLRDIEAMALILKAYQGHKVGLSETYFEEVKPAFHKISSELDVLTESLYFLRTIRNLYRLMVSAEEKIQEHYLDRLAFVFSQSNHPEWQTPESIRDQIQLTLQNSTQACDAIINYIKSKI
jgi:hypothetical protein